MVTADAYSIVRLVEKCCQVTPALPQLLQGHWSCFGGSGIILAAFQRVYLVLDFRQLRLGVCNLLAPRLLLACQSCHAVHRWTIACMV